MYNSITLIGRTTEKPVVKTLENGTIVGNFTLAVQRPYRNVNGDYETDFIPCVMWNSTAKSAEDYVKKGSLICVKAILLTKEDTITCLDENGSPITKHLKGYDVTVEKIIYLKL